MSKYGVVAIGGNRTHQEGYAREFAADPRCELIAVADEPNLPGYREGLNGCSQANWACLTCRLMTLWRGTIFTLSTTAPTWSDGGGLA